ncbi:MAG: GDP-mannose mannosyl hydrolase [Bacteroidales bacterium]|nr:GDP-mannose mannosyl hydrolase [Bacteroidales bacterium]
MYLSVTDFKQLIRKAPLVAIDLIIENDKGDFLMGWRANKPAQHHWFVPGGRIQKGEHLADAFRRIAQAELGLEIEMKNCGFLGVYEHLYNENVFDDPSFGTHYVVLGYHVKANPNMQQLPFRQHSQYKWFSRTELLGHPQVHENTKGYFRG